MSTVTLEQYARAWSKHPDTGIEISLGLEYKGDESPMVFAETLQSLATDAMTMHPNIRRMSEFLKAVIPLQWGGRAFFVEIDDGKCGVQIFLPYGMPRCK